MYIKTANITRTCDHKLYMLWTAQLEADGALAPRKTNGKIALPPDQYREILWPGVKDPQSPWTWPYCTLAYNNMFLACMPWCASPMAETVDVLNILLYAKVQYGHVQGDWGSLTPDHSISRYWSGGKAILPFVFRGARAPSASSCAVSLSNPLAKPCSSALKSLDTVNENVKHKVVNKIVTTFQLPVAAYKPTAEMYCPTVPGSFRLVPSIFHAVLWIYKHVSLGRPSLWVTAFSLCDKFAKLFDLWYVIIGWSCASLPCRRLLKDA
jgi:hypothetical protein